MLDAEAAMVRFLSLIAGEPDIARVPIMIDSSKWSVIEQGLKCIQGKGIVNSISMKEGEEAFIHHAKLVRRYGAAVVVMAFDEVGQADTRQRKFEICRRAYQILTERVGFPPEDIIFDPNIFAVATGIEEHNNYAVDFIEACALLNEGAPAVLLIVTEEQPPQAYAHWIDDVPFPYAVGLLLTPGEQWQLSLAPHDSPPASAPWPHALNLLRHLLDEQTAFQHAWNKRVWNWQRTL